MPFAEMGKDGFSLLAWALINAQANHPVVRHPPFHRQTKSPRGEDSMEPPVPATPGTAELALFTANNIWMLLSTFLVFIMHLGFASIEAGLTRAKNTVNILFKNVSIVAIGTLTYALFGFALMYPGTFMIDGLFGFAGFGIGMDADYNSIAYAGGGYTYWTDFIFQGMFAATAATIVSGAVAERIKVGPFLLFSTVFVGLVYPILGSWKWGGGFLNAMGCHDFAGSTLVHSVGGWGALASAWLLGPRIGKYVGGQLRPIMGHNIPLATIGMFLLWFGWYGFNGGSVLSADPESISRVVVITTLGACAGIMGSLMITWFVYKTPDLSMVLNGALGGLVGITAGADLFDPISAIAAGFVAGLMVVLAVSLFDKLKVDDPVGAISVHLVCGTWGTLAVGIFAGGAVVGEGADAYTISLGTQLIGVLAYGAVSFAAAFGLMYALKKTVGIRVDKKEELEGLDIAEHASEAYGGFQIFS
jgi:Amt family ammonium transporter